MYCSICLSRTHTPTHPHTFPPPLTRSKRKSYTLEASVGRQSVAGTQDTEVGLREGELQTQAAGDHKSQSVRRGEHQQAALCVALR